MYGTKGENGALKDEQCTMNTSDCILKGFKFPWREFLGNKRERERESEIENNITRTTMYLLNVKRNYNFIAPEM